MNGWYQVSKRAIHSEFYIFNGRLAQFKTWSNDSNAWESHWAMRPHGYLLEQYSTGYLGEFEIFTRYLPENRPVIEAGCGLGQLVMALTTRGYSVEGVDYAKQTITRIQTIAPELSVRVGDIYALDVPDGFYGGYISIGVFEHEQAGPLAGLREARRVLHVDGTAFITVPYLNPEREKWFRRLNPSHELQLSDDLQFYQYYFSTTEFEHYLEQARLKVVEVYPYAIYAGLTRDFAFGRWLEEKRFFHWRLKRLVLTLCEKAPLWARRRWGHMLMFVCRPNVERL